MGKNVDVIEIIRKAYESIYDSKQAKI